MNERKTSTKEVTDVENLVASKASATSTDEMEDVEEDLMDATWSHVFTSCCSHTPKEWGLIFLGLCTVLFFLFFFLVGLDLLGNAAKVMTSCSAGGLFGDETNPVAGLMVGILVTVLLQSSSTTTSIVVSLVGADTLSVKQGIYLIMGANIGTSVTSTIVAMGHLGNGDELERAFAGATVHDLFNFLTVAALFPIEVVTGYLYALTKAITKNSNPEEGESWDTPLDKLIDPIVKRIIDDNGDVVKAVAKGGSCSDFYPIVCEDGVVSADTCEVGLIKCYSDINECPIFFNPNATQAEEITAGAVCFVLAVLIMFICLAGLVFCLKKMLLNMSAKVIYKATDLNAYLAMVVGAGITMFVQSSSITTSVLTPLVGANVLRLETAFPMTLGANIGTTGTAFLAALVSGSKNSLQVALAHLFFNITGIFIWYPVPYLRNIPLNGARKLGKLTRIWRGFPLVYIAICFLLIPLFFFGLSELYMGATGLVALGVLVTIALIFGMAYTMYWCRYKEGREKTLACFARRQKMAEVMDTLPTDMEHLQDEVKLLRSQLQTLLGNDGAVPNNIDGNEAVGDEEEA